MGMAISLAVALLCAFFGLLWYKNQTPAKPATKHNKTSASKPSSQSSNRYRCVEMLPCLNACAAVKSYKHVKILLDKAPALPLSGCDSKKCECKFIRHNDRRSDDRRERQTSARQVIAGTQVIANNQDKREKTDRRKPQLKH